MSYYMLYHIILHYCLGLGCLGRLGLGRLGLGGRGRRLPRGTTSAPWAPPAAGDARRRLSSCVETAAIMKLCYCYCHYDY